MFSGKTGVPVASGEGVVASRPTLGLLVEVSAAVEGLPACIFDKFAELRPCGLLCKRGAQGMLLCDMLKEQSGKVTPWELAEPVGKAASKLLLAMPSEIKKEKKRALRRKLNVAAVESEVRGRAINLPMPSTKECEAVRRAATRATRESLTHSPHAHACP
jgi:hypothetical protein